LHDLTDLDSRGVPGVNMVTTEFRGAADAQSQALGFEPAIVWVPHPIQNRTPAELAALADHAIEPLLASLTAARN
jgi:hypothetical protein